MPKLISLEMNSLSDQARKFLSINVLLFESIERRQERRVRASCYPCAPIWSCRARNKRKFLEKIGKMVFHHSLKAGKLQRAGTAKRNIAKRMQSRGKRGRGGTGGYADRVQKKRRSRGSRALGNPGDWNSRRLRPIGRSSLFTGLSITPARPRHRNVFHFSSVARAMWLRRE